MTLAAWWADLNGITCHEKILVRRM
jgi:hypothetical protein